MNVKEFSKMAVMSVIFFFENDCNERKKLSKNNCIERKKVVPSTNFRIPRDMIVISWVEN